MSTTKKETRNENKKRKTKKQMNPDALEKLVTMKMPFGKHAGCLLCDLPANYLSWFARTGFPKGELGQLLELMHTLDHNNLKDLLKPLRK